MKHEIQHKQVKFKDFEIDEKIKPIIELLDNHKIETLYSCQGDENNMSYVVIKSSDNSEVFVKTLLMLDFMTRDAKMKTKPGKHFSSGFNVSFDCELGYFRYCIRCINLSEMEYMFKTVLDMLPQ